MRNSAYQTNFDAPGNISLNRGSNLTPLKKVSNRLMANVDRDKLKTEISQIYHKN